MRWSDKQPTAIIKLLDDTSGGTIRAQVPAAEIARWRECPDEIPANVVYPHDLPRLRDGAWRKQ
ncbi:MAG: hypothetical protein Q7T01_01125 [bacterium]|nr:hypothetical protein [bacterium]